MRKVLLSVMAIVLVANAYSQITITANDLPSISDEHLRDSLDIRSNTPNTFSTLFSDPNNTFWDASWMKGGDMDTIEFFDPVGTIYEDSFPAANMVMSWDFDFVMNKGNDGLNILGLGIEGEVRSFDSAVSYTPVPFGFTDKVTSKGVANFPFLIYQVSVQLERALDVFNYGTLKMPNDTIYNVLAVNATTEFSNLVISDTDTLSNSTEYEYAVEFYSKEFGFPILRVVLDEADKLTPISLEFIDLTTPTGINNSSAATLSIFPNPAKGAFSISSTSVIERVSVFNLTGQSVLEKQVNANTFDILSLPKGMYLVQVELLNGETRIEKMVVE